MKKRKMPQNDELMPIGASKRIMKRAAQGEEAVVVVMRQGRPSRVFGYEEYQKMVSLPKKVKPWKHRKASSPDPLGAVSMGKILLPLTREYMYEDHA